MHVSISHTNHKKPSHFLDRMIHRLGFGNTHAKFSEKNVTLKIGKHKTTVDYKDIAFVIARKPVEVFLKSHKVQKYAKKGFDVHKDGVIKIHTLMRDSLVKAFHDKEVKIKH